MKFRILVEMKWYFHHWWFILWYRSLHSASAAFLALVKSREARGLGHSSCWKGEKSEIKSENQVRLLGYLFHSFTKNQEFLMETSQPKVNLERRKKPPPCLHPRWLFCWMRRLATYVPSYYTNKYVNRMYGQWLPQAGQFPFEISLWKSYMCVKVTLRPCEFIWEE